jgi:argonaute-like protein implicated in RNA metabolism and viral defense
MTTVSGVIAELNRQHEPRERKQYLRKFTGFKPIFGVRLVLADARALIELPRTLDEELSAARAPHAVLADHIARALHRLQLVRDDFDVVIVYLPDRWEPGFYGPENDDFDLHAFVKATAATLGIPTQLLREGSALTYPCRCSVAWRLSIALYVKAGGTPWRLVDMEPDTASIGLGYGLRDSHDGRPRFVNCCSQAFDADGTGLDFIVYKANDFRTERDNPFLSRAEMHRLMARSLDLYQRRRGGRVPKRVIVHKTTEFQNEEIAGCLEALGACAEIELYQVQQNTAWRGVKIIAPRNQHQKGEPANYPVPRGTYLPIDEHEVLLWTQGDAPEAVGGRSYFKEGKGIPAPLLLRRFAGHGGWYDVCRHALSLTKMNWNSDALYDRVPATLSHATMLAEVARRLDAAPSGPLQTRFFI